MLKILSKAIKEPVSGIRYESNGWYVVVREEQPDNKRFSILFKKSMTGVTGLLYDRKNPKGKAVPLKFSNTDIKKYDIKPSTKEISPNKTPLVNEKVVEILSKGKLQDAHDYLKDKKLDKFIEGNETWRAGKAKQIGDCIIVPYTTFDLYPSPVGANIYGKNKKVFLSGAYRGSFHAHKLEQSNELWILGEGFRECFLASKIIERANVLEVGGLSKYGHVIKQIARLYPHHRIYILGEAGSEEALKELKTLSPNIRINFPREGKDFADNYALNQDEELMKELMLGVDVASPDKYYKPLGIENGKMIVYSKFLNTAIPLSADKPDEVIRNTLMLRGFEEWLAVSKKLEVSFIWEECVRAGLYQRNKIYGLGLWKHKEKLYYNTGEKLYYIKDGGIVPVNYIDHIDNDFLLSKNITDQPKIRDTGFQELLPELDNLLQACDWKHSFYGSLLLGFLVQSVFGGVLELRPNFWIFSDKTTSGKSWLCRWLRHNLLPIMKSQEGDMSTLAGARQTMANNSVPFHLDEIAEEGTVFELGAKKMLQFLRSSSGGDNTINLGTSQQESIHQRIKFSTLLSCISGENLLQEQDEARLIKTYMKRGDKERFIRELRPRFKALEVDKLKGFLHYTLTKYKYFDKFFNVFEEKLCGYEIGHRVRGLSAVLAGYSILYEDIEKGIELLEKIKENDPEMLEPAKRKDEESDSFLDLCHRIVPPNLLPDMENQAMRFIVASKKGFLKNFGIKVSREEEYLYISLRLAFDFLNTNFFKNNTSMASLRKYLERSQVYLGSHRTTLGTTKINVMRFDIREE